MQKGESGHSGRLAAFVTQRNAYMHTGCRFTFKAIPDVISMWLGQDIKILEKEEETSSILFQVDSKDSVLGHKRKYCEVAEVNSENDDWLD